MPPAANSGPAASTPTSRMRWRSHSGIRGARGSTGSCTVRARAISGELGPGGRCLACCAQSERRRCTIRMFELCTRRTFGPLTDLHPAPLSFLAHHPSLGTPCALSIAVPGGSRLHDHCARVQAAARRVVRRGLPRAVEHSAARGGRRAAAGRHGRRASRRSAGGPGALLRGSARGLPRLTGGTARGHPAHLLGGGVGGRARTGPGR